MPERLCNIEKKKNARIRHQADDEYALSMPSSSISPTNILNNRKHGILLAKLDNAWNPVCLDNGPAMARFQSRQSTGKQMAGLAPNICKSSHIFIVIKASESVLPF
jgi:hypothetical protein